MHCRSATRGEEPGSAARTASENPKWHSEQTAQEVGQQSACLTLTFDPACRLPAACSRSLVCRACCASHSFDRPRERIEDRLLDQVLVQEAKELAKSQHPKKHKHLVPARAAFTSVCKRTPGVNEIKAIYSVNG